MYSSLVYSPTLSPCTLALPSLSFSLACSFNLPSNNRVGQRDYGIQCGRSVVQSSRHQKHCHWWSRNVSLIADLLIAFSCTYLIISSQMAVAPSYQLWISALSCTWQTIRSPCVRYPSNPISLHLRFLSFPSCSSH